MGLPYTVVYAQVFVITGLSFETKTKSTPLGIYIVTRYVTIRLGSSGCHFVPLTVRSLARFFSGRIVVYRLGREHSSMNRGPTVSASQMQYDYTRSLTVVSYARYRSGRRA
jgi:hypothetical protein